MTPRQRSAKKTTGESARRSKKGASKRPQKSIEPAPEIQVVGWREWVALPQLGIRRIKAKLDTGARSSALHAFNVRPYQEKSQWFVEFDVHPLQRNDEVYKTCVAEAVDYRWVTNSGGGREKRFVIVTSLRLGGDTWPIEVTLTDRDQMGFRMLIGRTAMERRLIVDPALSHRVGISKKGNGSDRAILPARQSSKKQEEE